MRTLHELTVTDEPAIELIRAWMDAGEGRTELLPASERADDVIVALQVTRHSTLGALAHDTGGLLVQGGWLRILGSGHERMERDLESWNAGLEGLLYVADDAVGGFFALDGGMLGEGRGEVHYFAPDTAEWESLEMGFSTFVQWALCGEVDGFYETLRWDGWEADVAALDTDEAFHFAPPLWAEEGDATTSSRRTVPLRELRDLGPGV